MPWKYRSGRSLAGALTLCLLGPLDLFAQGGTQAAISGVVRDWTIAAPPGVTVEASSPVLIEKTRSAISDDQGLYRIVDLRTRECIASHSRCRGLPQSPGLAWNSTAAFTANVNVDMRVGSLEETVTVSGQSPVVDVQNTVQQRAITSAVIDAIPTGRTFQSLGVLIPGVSRTGETDVGGTAGERFSALSIHGSRSGQMPLIFDGMRYNNMNGSGGGGLTVFMINTGSVEEMSVQTAGGGAENQVSGVFQRHPEVRRQRLQGYFFANYAPGGWQSDNLTDELVSRGLTNVTTIDKIWDVNPAAGGPIVKDRLWFFTSVRYWGNKTNVEGIWENATLNTPFYTPDYNRPGQNGDTQNASENIRLTWQVNSKHRLALYYDVQQRNVDRRNLSSTTAPEATERLVTPRNYFTQVTWNWPITNSLLFEAGNTAYISSFTADRRPKCRRILWRSSNSQRGCAMTDVNRAMFEDISDAWNQKATLTYVTGAHNVKVGLQMIEGNHIRNSYVNRNLWAQVLNGVLVP